MPTTKRYSSPEECYEIFVGSITPQQFLESNKAHARGNPIEDSSIEMAVNYYCVHQWPWEEPCTPEIIKDLVAYIRQETKS